METMKVGIEGRQFQMVTENLTANVLGSGEADVYATPAMIAMMENTASISIKPYLEPGQTSVGTIVNIKHLAATPRGMEVRCESRLVSIDGRFLNFEVKAFDEVGCIGEGTHQRCVVDRERFQNKTNAKLTK